MHPVRRAVNDLDNQRREHNDKSANQDPEYGWTIAGVGEAVIKTTAFTRWPQ